MTANDSRGEESPDRPTHRCCTDSGEEIVFVAAKAGGGSGVLHTIRSCPHLDTARKVVEKPRSVYPEDRAICERCRGRISTSGGDNSGPWQRLQTADPDDLVTDGGADTVYVIEPVDGSDPTTYHWYRSCARVKDAVYQPEERSVDGVGDLELCQTCEVRKERNYVARSLSGLAQELFEADADDVGDGLRTDGGVPDADAFRVPTITELDAMRTALNLSQAELSRQADLEQGRFSHILHNDVDPHASTLRAFLDVLQDAEPKTDDDIERTGPKPEPSPNADHDPEDFDKLSAQLRHSPPDAVGEDPRPPEQERDEGVRTDGGRDLPTHHGVCRGCPDEWVGDGQRVHRDAEIHSLAHGHRTEVAEVRR
jgi:transcriptional regulator with XRE-family HTH domain